MSTAPARLELVPPSPPPPYTPRSVSAVLTPAERNANTAAGRRLCLRLWITGCAVAPVAILFSEPMGEVMGMILVLLGMLVMPLSGLVLWCIAFYARSREAWRAVLAASFALVAGVMLIRPAIHASTELLVASHQVELDALAAEIRRAVVAEPPAPGREDEADMGLNLRFDRELSAVGMGNVFLADGGLLFVTLSGSRVLYADGAAGPPPPACIGPRYRALGGRWFELRCRRAPSTPDEW